MRGLDTPVLLALLDGQPAARRLFDGAPADAFVTTEVNLFELETLARQRSPGRSGRLAALERLRRRLAVLPLESGGARRAALFAADSKGGLSSSDALVLGILDAHGASELVTNDPARFAAAHGRLQVVPMPRSKSKKRE